MKTNDLRIGNWVECLSEQRQILGITKHNGTNETARHYVEFKNIVPLKLLHIKPIPLTEEWLLKFGFGTIISKYYSIDCHFSISKGNKCWLFHIGNYGKSFKHVHQLQNLYHALTGEEL